MKEIYSTKLVTPKKIGFMTFENVRLLQSLKQYFLKYKYSALKRNITKHAIRKTKQKMKGKSILHFKRIL